MSDRQVLAEIETGACSLADVQERCGAATRCGGCLSAVQELVAHGASQLTAATV